MSDGDPLEDLALTRVVSVTLDDEEVLSVNSDGVGYYEATGMLVHALLLHLGWFQPDEDEDDYDD